MDTDFRGSSWVEAVSHCLGDVRFLSDSRCRSGHHESRNESVRIRVDPWLIRF
jgi:hypothetical protein